MAPHLPSRAPRVGPSRAPHPSAAKHAVSWWRQPDLVAVVVSLGLSLCPASPACATALIRGEVMLGRGVEAPPAATLYLTARPNIPDDVPSAILSGTRGKPPPIAAKRLTPPLGGGAFVFPLAFELDDVSDLTPEGQAEPARWWQRNELILSARLDSDGSAATRDPADLVGRAICSQGKEGVNCNVQLGGRGFGGKMLTRKN
ncbi:hypothetical protein T492DRAFT_1044144, partial [Pavlovales sp. CCMP2436]